MADQKLRAVPPAPEESEAAPAAEASSPDRSGRWIPIVLGALLALVLALLVWSRMELGERAAQVSDLQGQVRGLQEDAVRRDALIEAQKSRLSDVRGAVDSLMRMLDQPVTEP